MVTFSSVIQLPDTASGALRAWNLIEKLGEGDAGEVFLAQAMIDGRTAILKRPRHASFPSDSIRQANQIEKEGRILAALAASPQAASFTPALLDQSKPGTEFSDRFFIVISQARGVDMGSLARAALLGDENNLKNHNVDAFEGNTAVYQHLIDAVIRLGQLPGLLILRMLSTLIDFLESIHPLQATTSSGTVSGVVWNDVKPDHIFWDPVSQKFTFIDWGNAQFLESDGVSKDRLHSRMDDYQQLLEGIGEFIEGASPEIYRQLEWPRGLERSEMYTEGILPLRERARDLFAEAASAMDELRREESELLLDHSAGLEGFSRLQVVQERISAAGEFPDNANTGRFFIRVASSLIEDGQVNRVVDLLKCADSLPFLPEAERVLLLRLVEFIYANNLSGNTLLSALSGDWNTALWDLRRAALRNNANADIDEISEAVRERLAGGSLPRPFISLNRLIHSLQAACLSAEDNECFQELLHLLKDEIQPRWRQIEPDPPNSGVDYREIEQHFDQISELQPEAGSALLRALEQPRLQAAIVLDAWERKDIDSARSGLRRLLLWDPDRSRLFQADRALHSAAEFLGTVVNGLVGDESLQDFITHQELVARELRNQVGPAEWLDNMLDAFKQLRKGAEPMDVLVEHAMLRDELGWLVSLEPRRPLLAFPGRTISLDRLPLPNPTRPLVLGTRESAIGREGIRLISPLDAWVPEARGSSARVFLSDAESASGDTSLLALKLMRSDRLEYSLPLFAEEARVLTTMRDIPGVIPMLECGFIRLDGNGLPPGDQTVDLEALSGHALRFGPDSVHNFLSDLEKRAASGWIPYIGLEVLDQSNNLLLLCDTGHTHGRFLPILDGLVITQQICDILEVAHARNIVYRDHKILHYYWLEQNNGIYLVDWNIARYHPEGLSPDEIRFDLVQLAARALHVIFTGRAAPGALPMGPNRPEEIEAADISYTPQWIYDDQRLPRDIKELLEKALSGSYENGRQLREDAHTIYLKFSELI